MSVLRVWPLGLAVLGALHESVACAQFELSAGILDTTSRATARIEVLFEEDPWLPLSRSPFRERVASAVIDTLLAFPLGVPWSERPYRQWVIPCETFRGGSWMLRPEEYWAFRCTRSFESGHLVYSAYLIGENDLPSVESVEWRVTGRDARDSLAIRGLYSTIVDTLRARLGTGATGDGESEDEGYSADTKTGMVHVALSARARFGEADAIRISVRSHAFLRSKDDPRVFPLEEAYFSEDDPPARWREEVAAWLEPRHPELSAILDSSTSLVADLPVAVRALELSRSSDLDREERDALALGSHLWLERGTADVWASVDTALVRSLKGTLGPFGARLDPVYDEALCYDLGLTADLVRRPTANRWTELAFLERQLRGWSNPCSLCGWDSIPDPDLFRPAIERGEAFLIEHPNASIWWQVARTVAEAHETAWSLSKTHADDEYIRAIDYVLEAPAHRTRAMELYELLITKGPPELVTPGLRGRARRLVLDIDTGYHEYWCVWD